MAPKRRRAPLAASSPEEKALGKTEVMAAIKALTERLERLEEQQRGMRATRHEPSSPEVPPSVPGTRQNRVSRTSAGEQTHDDSELVLLQDLGEPSAALDDKVPPAGLNPVTQGEIPVPVAAGALQQSEVRPSASGMDLAKWVTQGVAPCAQMLRPGMGGSQCSSQVAGPQSAWMGQNVGAVEGYHSEGAVPLGFYLHPATKEKIWRGEFVDVFSLLFRVEPMEEQDQHPKVERNFDNWLSGFLIYVSVLLQAQLWRGLALIKYMDIILRIRTFFVGPAWLQYDEMFRMQAAVLPSLPWDRIEPDLWLDLFTQYEYVDGPRADSGHIVAVDPRPLQRKAAMKKAPKRVCWMFNARGKCFRDRCRFKHECATCAGPHPNIACE